MKAVWTVARRDLKALFDHPTGYILLVVFLVVNDFLFFRSAYLQGVASLRPMLDLLPWLLLFLVPAVTMRALAEDLRSGTLEVVLAQPITEVELVGGKYLGQVLFLWGALALTIPIPIGLSWGADVSAGIVVAQYAGAALLMAGLAGVGLWASSVTRNQVTAFILGVAVMFLLMLVGLDPLIMGLPPVLAQVAQSLGVLAHFVNITRGVIDLRDVIYFATLAGVFLTFAYLSLMRRKLAHGSVALRQLQLGTVLMTAVLVVVNLFGRHIGGRLDLTPGNQYTLSRATRQILRGLDDFVTIKLFVSKELPTQVALLKRDVGDLLRDLRAAGGDNVRVVTLTPGGDDEAAEEARRLGIPEIQFNVVGESEFQLRTGYFGLAVQYADGSEVIPFVERTDDLEYRIMAFVRALTRTDRPVVGLVTQADPRDPGGGFQAVRQELEQQYEVRTLTATDSTPIADDVGALVVVGSPFFLTDTVVANLKAFLARGGGALVLTRGMQLEQLMAQPLPVAWNRVLEPYGVQVRPDLAYDLSSNEAVSMATGVGNLRILVNYPFWIRALSTRQSVVNREMEALMFPWASTIDASKAPDSTVVPLFTTTRAGGRESGRVFLAPQREFNADSLSPQVVGILVDPSLGSDTTLPRGRVIVVGNSDFVSDRFAQAGAPAVSFVLNAVDWLVQDEALIGIRSKNRTPPPLAFDSATVRDLAKYGNIAGVPLLLALFAVWRLWRRRQLATRPYRAEAAATAEAA